MLSTLAFVFAGSGLLAWPTDVSARCTGSGASFRCPPIVSDVLRRRSLGLPPRVTPRSSHRYQYEGHTFTAPSTGAMLHRYRYQDGHGKTYHGTIEMFPGRTVRHRGRWR